MANGHCLSSHKWHEEMLNYLENATSEGALVQRSLASHQIYVDIINDVRISYVPTKSSECADGLAGHSTREYQTRAQVSILSTSDEVV